MIKVALIDDHFVVRSGFAQLLSLEEDIDVVCQYGNAADAWKDIFHHNIDVVVMDIAMPDESGLQLLARLRKKQAQFRTIVLSIYDSAAFVQNALDEGACGYLTKHCGPKELVQAVRTVYNGGCYLCADALKGLRQTPSEQLILKDLTPREREIFTLLIKGMNAKSIGELLDLSHKTVHVHRANILGKLQCESTIDLVHFAIQHQLITH